MRTALKLEWKKNIKETEKKIQEWKKNKIHKKNCKKEVRFEAKTESLKDLNRCNICRFITSEYDGFYSLRVLFPDDNCGYFNKCERW